MSAFITNEGFTIQQFYEEVQRELEALPEGSDENASFASVLFSALDFTTFCEMMNDVREGRGVVFCPPLVSLETDFYGEQDEDDIEAFERLNSRGMEDADSKMDGDMIDMGFHECKGADGSKEWGEGISCNSHSESKKYFDSDDHKGYK